MASLVVGEIVKDMVEAIISDLKPAKNSELLLLVNGLGATPLMELYLIFNSASNLLKQHGLKITRSLVGNYTTAIDMAGASITVCLLDDEIKHHWDSKVHTPALRWGV
jgi:phosphoenolpyruvate---glycerone phosphotransferase subunit DhaK